MTKSELQKEIKDKVKPGIKPSDLKKLKRSKSTDDISHQSEKNLKIKNLELEKQLEQTTQALAELTKIHQDNPPSHLLREQLKEKQKEIEESREKLEEINSKLTETLTELDNSLIARAESVKQFDKVYEKFKNTELQLLQTEDDATDDIIRQDDEISKLKSENRKLKLTNQSLQKDLELAHRAVEWRKSPLPGASDYSFLRFALYSLIVGMYVLWLVKSFKNIQVSSQDYD